MAYRGIQNIGGIELESVRRIRESGAVRLPDGSGFAVGTVSKKKKKESQELGVKGMKWGERKDPARSTRSGGGRFDEKRVQLLSKEFKSLPRSDQKFLRPKIKEMVGRAFDQQEQNPREASRILDRGFNLVKRFKNLSGTRISLSDRESAEGGPGSGPKTKDGKKSEIGGKITKVPPRTAKDYERLERKAKMYGRGTLSSEAGEGGPGSGPRPGQGGRGVRRATGQMGPSEVRRREKRQRAVSSALDNALESDYDFRKADPEEVAVDLGTYSADLEGLDPKVLIPHIKAWQASKTREK